MASSSPSGVQSVGYAQDHIKVSCDLCEEEKDAVSHCTQCVKNMCVSCQKFHDKLHTGHKIITIFEGRIINYLNTKCPTHDLLFTYYCEKCKINICNVCRQENHNKCNLADIGRHAEMLKNHLTKKVAEQRKCLEEIDKTSDNIDDHLINFDRIIDSQISLIETETDKKHRDLDIQKLNFIQQLKSQQASTHKTVRGQKQTLLDLRTSIDNITESIKVKIDLVPDAGVLQLENECNDKLETTSKKTTFDLPNPSTFTPSTVPLGSLQNTDSTTIIIDTRIDPPDTSKDLPDTESPSPVPSLHHSTPADPSPSLRHEISVVRQLSVDPVFSCTSDGSTCWVACFPSTVKLYNQRGDQLLTVRLSHWTHHTALTTTGELLVSGDYTTVISRVNKKGQVLRFTDISARDVQCVTLTGLVTTRQDDVFVCVRMTGDTKDKVLTFSARGKKISELNSHFFTSTKLYGIHAVSRDTFCVQDGRGREGGRLVFVDGGGQLVRHIDRTTTELQRDIRTVVGDRHGHLIIATGNEYIHVLSGEGTCIRTYHIQGSGWVQGVSVGEDDVLWIGTRTGKLIVAKYLE